MTHQAPFAALIALDDAAMRTRACGAARQANFACSTAGAWHEALASCERSDFDVVVTGALPAPGDGVRLIEEIRARSPSSSTPAVVFLGGDEEVWIDAHAAGAEQCLPADASERLLAAVLGAASRHAGALRRPSNGLRSGEAMAEAIADGVIVIDAAGGIRWANGRAAAMFGYGRDGMPGRDAGQLVAEPQDEAALCLGVPRPASWIGHFMGPWREAQGQRSDGTAFPLEISVASLHNGGDTEYVAVLRDISGRKANEAEMAEKAARLERMRAQNQTENEFARQVVERLLRTHGRDDVLLRHYVAPAEEFSGDVVAAMRSSAGALYVMLADAAGHGLAAAISLLPAISVFYGMAARDLPLALIVGEMNAKLRTSMPVGRFVAAALVRVDHETPTGEVWIGGTPDLLWLDDEGRVLRRFVSRRMALGIVDGSPDYTQPEAFEWSDAGQLFVCSDGVLEAQDGHGQPFGMSRLLTALVSSPPESRIDTVRLALDRHLNRGVLLDDISMLSIDLPA